MAAARPGSDSTATSPRAPRRCSSRSRAEAGAATAPGAWRTDRRSAPPRGSECRRRRPRRRRASARVAFDADGGAAAGRRLDGVAQQFDHLHQPSSSPAPANRRGADAIDPHARRVGVRAGSRSARAVTVPSRTGRRSIVCRPARSRDVQDPVHQAEEPLGTLVDDRHEALLARCQRAATSSARRCVASRIDVSGVRSSSRDGNTPAPSCGRAPSGARPSC